MKKNFIKKYIEFNQKNKGFTLVETLVAVAIFTVSILSLLVVLSKGISDTGYAKKKMIASYLAEEGIEYIRNLRDTYVLYSSDSQTGWNNFNNKMTLASCNSSEGCYFDDRNVSYSDQNMPMTNLILQHCASSSCPGANLLYDNTTGRYNYIAGTDSTFVRVIKISIVSPNETKIYSTVYWPQGSGTYSISFSESLFNWVE